MALNPLSARERQVPAARTLQLASIEYATRADMYADRANTAEGDMVYAEGVAYIRDTTATGWQSALHDLGLNGYRLRDGAENAYLAAWFSDDANATIHFWTSADGLNWNRLNGARLQVPGGFFLQSRDPSIVFYRGEFWVSVTNYGATWDTLIFRSRDLVTWSRDTATFGPSAINSATVPLPGGLQPADLVWAAELVVDGDDLYAFPSVRFGNDTTDAFGNTIKSKFIFRSRLTGTSPLTFGPLEYVPLGNLHPAGTFQAVGSQLAIPTNPLRHQLFLDGRMGLDVSFSQRFRTRFTIDDLVFIPAARGGSGFANNQWRAGNPSYTIAVTRLQQFFAANPGAVMEALIWDQGEADQSNPDYENELVDLFVRLRAAVPQLVGVPILMGLRATWSSGATTINAAITAAAARIPNARTVSAASLNHTGDSTHYDAASIRTLGERYYEAWIAARGGGFSGPTKQMRAVAVLGQSNAVGQAPLDDPSGRTQIDAAAVKDGSTWYFLTKDEIAKTIRVYQGASLAGGFTFVQELSGPFKVEGVSAVPRFTRNGAGVRSRSWRVYTDAHADLEGVALGRQYFWDMTTLASAPTGPTAVVAGRPIRHGAVKNLAAGDPAAVDRVARAAAFLGGDTPDAIAYMELLAGGSRTIRPQPGVLYYTTGVGQVVDLTIKEGAADVFHVACLANTAGTGINVLAGGTSIVATPLSIGFGYSSDQIVTFRRQTNGQYVPESGGHRAAFSANKGGTPQTVTATTETLVTFPNEDHDNGGFFNPANGRWTPPAGRYRISAGVLVAGTAAGANNAIILRKNGTQIRQGAVQTTGAGSTTLVVDGVFYANGTDYFDVTVILTSAGTKTVTGATENTWFEGSPA